MYYYILFSPLSLFSFSFFWLLLRIPVFGPLHGKKHKSHYSFRNRHDISIKDDSLSSNEKKIFIEEMAEKIEEEKKSENENKIE